MSHFARLAHPLVVLSFCLVACAEPASVVACAADGTCPTGQHCAAGVCAPGAPADATAGVASDTAGQDAVGVKGDAAADTVAACDPPLGGGPSPRGDLAGGFVGDRLLVLYGDEGVPQSCQSNPKAALDAWIFSPCGGWQAMTGVQPPPRARAASAVDAASQRLYFFGGRHRAAKPGSGSACKVNAECPTSEECTSGACKVNAANLYSVYRDLWAWDAATSAWSLLADGKSAPPARSNAVLAVRPDDGSLWLHGGNASGNGLNFTPLADTWRYDPATAAWKVVTTTGKPPSARLFHAGAITSDGQSLVIFSGGDAGAFIGPFLGDTWRLDLETLAWKVLPKSGPQPLPRIKAGLLAIPGQKRLLMFGGHDDGAVGNRNDLWWLDPATGAWEVVRAGDLGKDNDPDVPFKKANAFCDFPPDFTQLDKDSPERREAFVWGWDPARKQAWLFGGKSDCGLLRDVWTLNPAALDSPTVQPWQVVDDTPTGWSCGRYLSPCNTLCN